MVEFIINKLKSWSPTTILLWALLACVLGAAVVVAVISLVLHGTIRPDFMITGFITSLLVALIVVPMLTRMIRLLREAETQALQASAARSRFLAHMSHELRSPLNAIIGMSELCLTTPLNDRQRHYVGSVKMASDSLLGIINDILDLSKIDAEKLDLEQEPFRIDAVMDRLSSVAALQAEKKNIELIYDIADLDHPLLGDALRLGQVLINLVNNALKFSEGGSVIVRLDPVSREGDVIELRFSVTDQGIGLTQEQIARLFQPFSQADISTTRRFGGTGLGLAISQRLVALMGGRIGVDSEPGSGSTFYFTARFGIDHQRETDREFRSRLATLVTTPLLFIDDSPIGREVFERRMSAMGLPVVALPSIDSALTHLGRTPLPEHPVCFIAQRPATDRNHGFSRLRERLTRGNQEPVILLMVPYGDESHDSELDPYLAARIRMPVTAGRLMAGLVGHLHARVLPIPAEEALPARPAQWCELADLDILLVEDVELNRILCEEMFAQVGLQLRIACDGEQALTEIARCQPDLVLMDCQMPVMDGYTTTRKIRENPDWAGLPVIALTANAMAGDEEQCIAAGMTGFLGKPLDMDAVRAILQKQARPNSPPG